MRRKILLSFEAAERETEPDSAVADLGKFQFAGFFAWLVWAFVHIRYLIEFDSKVIVLFRWSWNYFTRKRGVRLITGEDPFPLVDSKKK